MSTINRRRGTLGVLAGGALVGLFSATIAVPTAAAQPQCTAANLSTVLGGVSSATGQFLADHPGANDVVTNAGSLSDGEGEQSIRNYFMANPGEWSQLQGIATPLRELRQQCEVQVAPAEIARLFDAMSA